MFRYEVSIRLEKAKQFKDVFVSEFSHKLTEQEQQGYLRFLNKNNQGFFAESIVPVTETMHTSNVLSVVKKLKTKCRKEYIKRLVSVPAVS